MLRDFPRLPVELPRLEILKRMGYNRHLSVIPPAQEARLTGLLDDAFSLCALRGRLLVLPVLAREADAVILAQDVRFRSAALAQLLADSTEVALMAVTAGEEVVRKIAQLIGAGAGADALVYDATASETTDAGLDWLQALLARELPRRGLRQTRQRFSPGYGDLGLEAQAELFRLLRLQEWGLTLSDRLIISPEKTVTALAGLEPAQ